MAYNVQSGEIQPNVLYYNVGAQAVVYNSNTYATGQYFRGVFGINTYVQTGTSTKILIEVFELSGACVEFSTTGVDNPNYLEINSINGFAVEFALNEAEKIIQETTRITGFSIELIDYPFYSFEIIESRL